MPKNPKILEIDKNIEVEITVKSLKLGCDHEHSYAYSRDSDANNDIVKIEVIPDIFVDEDQDEISFPINK